MKKRFAALAAAALFTPLLGFGGEARAQATEAAFRTTTLNISASGEVRRKPDQATIGLGVTQEAAGAKAATAQAAARMNAIVAALKQAGVAPRDIRTQQISLSPKYSDRSHAPRTIIAHEAAGMVTVTLRDLDQAGPLIDAAIEAGANRVDSVRLGLSDPGAAQREARDEALRLLQQDAESVAATMGQKIVRLVSVNTQSFSEIIVTARRIPELAVPGTQIEPGEVSVRASASATYELAPR